MPAHARGSADCSFEIDSRALGQRAEVGAPEGLGRDPDHERSLLERGDGQARAIDADTVAKLGIPENVGAVADGQGGAASAGGGVIVRLERGDGWLRLGR